MDEKTAVAGLPEGFVMDPLPEPAAPAAQLPEGFTMDPLPASPAAAGLPEGFVMDPLPAQSTERKEPLLESLGAGIAKAGTTAIRATAGLMQAGGEWLDRFERGRNALGKPIRKALLPEWYNDKLDTDPTVGEVIRTAGKTATDYYRANQALLEQNYPTGDITKNPELLHDAQWWVDSVSNGLTSIATGLAAGGGTVAGGALAGGALEAAPEYDQLRQEGMGPIEASTRSALFGTAVALLEKIPLQKILKPAAGKVLSSAWKAAIREASTEWAEQPVQAIINNLGRQGVDTTEFGKRVLDAARQGLNVIPATLVSGGLLGGSNAAATPEYASLDNIEARAKLKYGMDKVQRLDRDVLTIDRGGGRVQVVQMVDSMTELHGEQDGVRTLRNMLEDPDRNVQQAAAQALAAAEENEAAAGAELIKSGWGRSGQTLRDVELEMRDGTKLKADVVIQLVSGRATRGTMRHENLHALSMLAGLQSDGERLVDPTTGRSYSEERLAQGLANGEDHPVLQRIRDYALKVVNKFRTNPQDSLFETAVRMEQAVEEQGGRAAGERLARRTEIGAQLRNALAARRAAAERFDPRAADRAREGDSILPGLGEKRAMEPGRWKAQTPKFEATLEGAWDVVEADELVTSNRTDYDQALQPRNRATVASKEQISSIATAPDPARLMDSTTTDAGAPMVDQRNQVVSGNGRSIGLLEAYRANRAGAYKDAVVAQAQGLGLEKAALMRRPVLVRRIDNTGGAELAQVAEWSNRPQILMRSDAEQAEADARMLMDRGMIESFIPDESGNMRTAANRPFLQAFVRESGDASLLDARGEFAPDIEPRVKRAVLAAVLGDHPRRREIVQDLIERAEEYGLKRQSNGIMTAGPALLKLAQEKPDYDLRAPLAQALQDLLDYSKGKTAGNWKTLRDYLAQQEMFESGRTEESVAILERLERAPTSAGTREWIDNYAGIVGRIDLTTTDMFGQANATRPQVLGRALNETGNNAGRVQQGAAQSAGGAIAQDAGAAAGAAQRGPSSAGRAAGAAAEAAGAVAELSGAARYQVGRSMATPEQDARFRELKKTWKPGGEFVVKPPKTLYRGSAANAWGEGRGLGTFGLGRGLYSSPSRKFAAMYGAVETLTAEQAFPRNPLVLSNVAGGAPQAFMDWALRESGLPNARRFNEKYPDPGEFVRSKGYDGVVAGDEIVRYAEDSGSVEELSGAERYQVGADIRYQVKRTDGEDVSKQSIRVDPDTLTLEVLARIDKIAKREGYDSRGAQDVREHLITGRTLQNGTRLSPAIKDGVLTGEWAAFYREATEGKAKRIQKIIEKRSAESQHPHVNRARLRQLGYTTDLREAGYITPDGRLIDLSGKREGGSPGQRAYDHREAGGTSGMQEFMDEGNIRINGNSGSIDISAAPTKAQETIIERIMQDAGMENVYIDLSDGLGQYDELNDRYASNGERTQNISPEFRANPRKVLNQIRAFYDQPMYQVKRVFERHRTIQRVQSSEEYKELLTDLDKNTLAYYETQNLAGMQQALGEATDADLERIMAPIDAAATTESQQNQAVLAAAERLKRLSAAAETDPAARTSFRELTLKLSRAAGTWAQLVRQMATIPGQTPEAMVETIRTGIEQQGGTLPPAGEQKLLEAAKKDIEARRKVQQAEQMYMKLPSAANAQVLDQLTVSAMVSANTLMQAHMLYLPKTWGQIIKNLMQGNVLTPVSLVANTVGNIVNMPARGVAQTIAATTERLAYALGMVKERSVGQPLADQWAWARGATEGLAATPVTLRTGLSYRDLQAGGEVYSGFQPLRAWVRMMSEGGRSASGTAKLLVEGTLGIPAETMFRFLAAGDAPFYQAHYEQFLHELGRLKGLDGAALDAWMRVPDAEAKELATERAKAAVYQGKAGPLARIMMQLANMKPESASPEAADLINALTIRPLMLFVKTPTQVLAEALKFVSPEWSTASMLLHASGAARARKAGKHAEVMNHQREAFQALGRVGVGLAIRAAVGVLIEAGLLAAAGGKNDKEKELARLRLKPYHVNMSGLERLLAGKDPSMLPGDKQVDYRTMGIVGLAMNIAASEDEARRADAERRGEGYEATKMGAIEAAATSAPALASAMLDMSMMKGSYSLLQAMKTKSWGNWIASYFETVSSVALPNTLKAASRAVLPYMPETEAKAKEATTAARWEAVGQEIVNRIDTKLYITRWMAGKATGKPVPMPIEDLPAKVDLFGRVVPMTPSGRGPAYHLIDTFKLSEIPYDQYAQAVDEVYRATNDSEVIPGRLKTLTNPRTKQPIKMTAAEVQRLNEIAGIYTRWSLDNAMRSQDWAGIPMANRAYYLRGMNEAVQRAARNEMLRELRARGRW